MAEGYLLGIDAGTSVVKSVIFAADGEVMAVTGEKLSPDYSTPGWAEQDVDQVWEAVQRTVREVLTSGPVKPHQIVAVGVAGQGDGCWLMDAEGRPARRAVTWLDGRAGDIVARWEKEGIAATAFDINGAVPFPGTQAAVIRWLDIHEPEALARSRWALFCKDWVKYWLTGEICTDPSDGSRNPFDLRRQDYSDELFTVLGIAHLKRLFPPVRPSAEIIGRVNAQGAAATGLVAGTPVVCGMIDCVSAGVGVGAIEPGQAYTIMGTTSFNALILDSPTFEPKNVGMSLLDGIPDRVVRAMPAMTGAPNLEWFVDQFCQAEKQEAAARQVDVYQVIEEEAGQIPPGSEGLLYLPYLSPGGERAPFVKPSARAQFSGFSMKHSRAHFLRAVYEGVVLSILDCYQHIPYPVETLRLSGGGAKSRLWPQILADALGTQIEIPAGGEFGARGVALLAGVAVGLYKDASEAVRRVIQIERRYQPDPAKTKVYLALYELYRNTYRQNWDLWEQRQAFLHALQG
jgi:sugar (pentulose or hexulose) kinase